MKRIKYLPSSTYHGVGDKHSERYCTLIFNRDINVCVGEELEQCFSGFLWMGEPCEMYQFQYTCPVTPYEDDE